MPVPNAVPEVMIRTMAKEDRKGVRHIGDEKEEHEKTDTIHVESICILYLFSFIYSNRNRSPMDRYEKFDWFAFQS